MATKQNIVVAFDAYGTLLSTESIGKKLAAHFHEAKANAIAQAWRKYQLEYTWRLNSMGQYEDFSKLTRRSLQHSLSEAKCSLNDSEIDDLMKAYDSLTIFPDVAKCLSLLRETPQITPVVFSNGTHSMVSASIKQSPDLQDHADVFKDIVVVEEPRRFKPAPEVYHHLARKVGKNPEDATSMSELWLVSGNPFDVVGARAVGMNAIWIDRAGTGWQDRMVEGDLGRPTEVVQSLDKVVVTVTAHHD